MFCWAEGIRARHRLPKHYGVREDLSPANRAAPVRIPANTLRFLGSESLNPKTLSRGAGTTLLPCDQNPSLKPTKPTIGQPVSLFCLYGAGQTQITASFGGSSQMHQCPFHQSAGSPRRLSPLAGMSRRDSLGRDIGAYPLPSKYRRCPCVTSRKLSQRAQHCCCSTQLRRSREM